MDWAHPEWAKELDQYFREILLELNRYNEQWITGHDQFGKVRHHKVEMQLGTGGKLKETTSEEIREHKQALLEQRRTLEASGEVPESRRRIKDRKG